MTQNTKQDKVPLKIITQITQTKAQPLTDEFDEFDESYEDSDNQYKDKNGDTSLLQITNDTLTHE